MSVTWHPGSVIGRESAAPNPATRNPVAHTLPSLPARDRWTGRAAVIFGVVATALSVAGSWIPSLWGDEAASIMSAERSVPSLFAMLGHVDAVHGTYYLFLHFWIDAFGASPFSVRLPGSLAVGVAVAGVVLLAERLAGFRTAILAGVVCMVLPRMTYLGLDARSYAFSAACAVWLTLLLVRLVASGERRVLPWVGYAVLLAVSTYVFLYLLLMIPVHLAILMSVPERRRLLLRNWWWACGVGILLAGPVIGWAVVEQRQISYLASQDAVTLDSVGVFQWFWDIDFAVIGWTLIAVAIVLAGLAVVRRRWGQGRIRGQGRGRIRGARSILLQRHPDLPSLLVVAAAWTLIPLVILLVANLVDPIYTVRYLSFAAPGVALLLAVVMALPTKRWITTVLLAILLIGSVPSYLSQRTPYAQNGSDWAEVSAVLAAHATPGDAVVFDEAARPSQRLRLALHTYPAGFAGLKDPTLKIPFYRNNWWGDAAYRVAQVPQRFDGVSRVWLLELHSPGMAPDAYGMADLQRLGFSVTRHFDEHHSVIYELVR